MAFHSFTFPYETKVETIPGLKLEVECLRSLDDTIDAFFAEYERTNRAELFEGLCPYFGVPWPAGLALAKLIDEEAEKWRGREVLEIGCGLALPSLVLSRAGALVTATDLHPDVPHFLDRNRVRNRIPGPDFLFLDWRLDRSLPPAELILGSDIVYDRQQPVQIVKFLLSFSSWREAIFTDPGRPYWEVFVSALREQGWKMEERIEGGVFLVRLWR